METEKSLQDIISEGNTILNGINKDWVSLTNARQLIQKRDELLYAIGEHRKLMKDKRLEQKDNELTAIKQLMDQWAKKTPAYEEVQNDQRSARYELEKLDIAIDTVIDQAKNRAYYIRINELDLNKVWVGSDF